MKFRVQTNLNEDRWYMTAPSVNAAEDKQFREWMDANCPDCMCVLRFNSGEPYWELRGGDVHLRTLILMRWS